MAKKEAQIDLLLQNTIALQKTLVELATEIKTLNKKVSNLVTLFETASSAFKQGKTKGMPSAAGNVPQNLLEKIDTLVEQNKTLAKGLLLLEKTIREREQPATAIRPSITARPKPKVRPIKRKPVEEEEEEATEETEEEYKPQPLPEFSF